MTKISTAGIDLLLLFILVTKSSQKIESFDELNFNNDTNPTDPSNSIKDVNKNVTDIQLKLELPADCSQREKLKSQPVKDHNSRLKKCCPIGESLSNFQPNISRNICDISENSFTPNIINAVLYDNCIEDEEIKFSLPLEIRNPCNASLYYTNDEDMFYVMQDGSLLILDEFANDTYAIENEYCIDMDESGKLYAFVCVTSIDELIKRNNILLVSTLTLISIPLLILVAYIHIVISEFRTVHGISLASMSMCLAIGFSMHSLAYLFELKSDFIGYAIQHFILSYFFWFLVICFNSAINIWYLIIMKQKPSKLISILKITFYFLTTHIASLVLVVLTAQKGLPGMPSYFFQGFTESVLDSQRYFIPPVTTAIFGSLMILIVSFFGFQRINQVDNFLEDQEEFCKRPFEPLIIKYYDEIRNDAKCASLIGIIMAIAWLLELVSFYTSRHEYLSLLLDMINGLQGVFIFAVHFVVRQRRTVIMRWWNDHGSHDIERIELSTDSE